MEWLLYIGIAAVAFALLLFLSRPRRKKQEESDDIYPMW